MKTNSGSPCLPPPPPFTIPTIPTTGTMARYQTEIGVDGKADLPFTSGPKPMALSRAPCTSSTRRRPARYGNGCRQVADTTRWTESHGFFGGQKIRSKKELFDSVRKTAPLSPKHLCLVAFLPASGSQAKVLNKQEDVLTSAPPSPTFETFVTS